MNFYYNEQSYYEKNVYAREKKSKRKEVENE